MSRRARARLGGLGLAARSSGRFARPARAARRFADPPYREGSDDRSGRVRVTNVARADPSGKRHRAPAGSRTRKLGHRLEALDQRGDRSASPSIDLREVRRSQSRSRGASTPARGSFVAVRRSRDVVGSNRPIGLSVVSREGVRSCKLGRTRGRTGRSPPSTGTPREARRRSIEPVRSREPWLRLPAEKEDSR